MFAHLDRVPMDSAPSDVPAGPRPWALRLIAPFKRRVDVGVTAAAIDPVTQLGVTANGEVIHAKHRATNTGTETSTATGGGDGQSPGQDQDHSQDSDQD